jgi:GAF domain-containing protein
MVTSSPDASLPDHVEDRLAEFTELMGTAVANSHAREELTRLAEEQAALRRIATLVGEGRAAGRRVRSGERGGRPTGSGRRRRAHALRD